MTKFLPTVLIALLLAHCLGLIGFLGYGAATGRFSSEKRAQYLATWRGEKLVPEPVEVTEELKEEETPQQASARIAAAEVDKEITIRETQRSVELLRAMQMTLDSARSKLEKDIEQLRLDKAAFAAEMAHQRQLAQEEGFQKALKYYTQIKPKYAKADFMKMDDEQVVRFLAAMKSGNATRILNQFKTPDEQAKRLRVMELLKEKDVLALNERK